MPIYETARYEVHAGAVQTVKDAIEAFVRYVAEHEPGTKLYAAWQEIDEPTRFTHLFIFEDEAAQEIHSSSDAVRTFESVYSPELVGGPVVFIDHVQVASNA